MYRRPLNSLIPARTSSVGLRLKLATTLSSAMASLQMFFCRWLPIAYHENVTIFNYVLYNVFRGRFITESVEPLKDREQTPHVALVVGQGIHAARAVELA